MNYRLMRFAIAAGLAIGLAGTGFAAGQDGTEMESQAVKFTGTEISFDLPEGAHNVTVTIAGPRGFRAEAYFPDGVASLDLSEHGTVIDGSYKYQMTGASDEAVEYSNASDSGRAEDDGRTPKKSVSMYGRFRVAKGAILAYDNIKETE